MFPDRSETEGNGTNVTEFPPSVESYDYVTKLEDEPPLSVIGSIIDRPDEPPAVRLVDRDGQRLAVEDGGYRHFGNEA